MKLTDKHIGNLTMFCVVSFFAINIPVSKHLLANEYISPYGLTIARMLFATIAFGIASLFTKKEPIARKDHFFLLFAGILGFTLNQGLLVVGLANTSPIDASIIRTGTPLFAIVIAAFAIKEPITVKKAIGVLIGMSGAIYLVYSTRHHSTIPDISSSIEGNLIVVCSALSYAVYLIVSRPLTARYSSITIMKWMFLYSTIMLTPFVYNDLANAPLFYQTDTKPYILIGYVVIFATFVPFALMPIAQKKIRATTISMYNNLLPLIVSFIAILSGQDHFSFEKAVSGISIFLGVYLVTQSKSETEG